MIQYLLRIISTWFNSDLDSPSLCHPVSVSFESFMRYSIHDSFFHALFIHDSILTWTYQVSVSYYSVLTWTHQVSVTKSLFHLKVSCVIHTWFNSDLDSPSLCHQVAVSFAGFMHDSYMIQFWLGLTKSRFHSQVFNKSLFYLKV